MLYLDYSRKDGQWLPNRYGGRENLEAVAFLQEMNATVYKRVPGAITIAEESTSWPGVTRATHLGGLGFGFKWDMGWMHDTLAYISHEPVHRQYHHNELTFSMMYAYTENFVLPLSHDEVVHGKGSLLHKIPGDRWQQMATLRALYAYMWAHPGKQLLFMGQEFGQGAEWAESRSLDWWLLDSPDHRGVHPADHRSEPALPRHQCALVTRLRARWVRLDRRQRCVGQRLLVPALRHRRLDAGLHRQLRRHAARQLPNRAACRRALGRGAQHRRRCATSAPAWGTSAGSTPSRRDTTGSRPRRRCGCRRSALSGCVTPAEGAPLGVQTRGRTHPRLHKIAARESEQRACHLAAGRRDPRVLRAE